MNSKDETPAKSMNQLLSLFMRQAATEAASRVRKEDGIKGGRPLRKRKKGQTRART